MRALTSHAQIVGRIRAYRSVAHLDMRSGHFDRANQMRDVARAYVHLLRTNRQIGLAA